MHQAGFNRRNQPGLWYKESAGEQDAEVDLLVPASFAPGRRAARLAGQAQGVAILTPGLEPILFDNEMLVVAARESTDQRSFHLAVGGVAALLIAKLHKLDDRIKEAESKGSTRRLDPKDAGDLIRLLLVADDTTRATLHRLASHPQASQAVTRGQTLLEDLFGRPRARR